MQLASTNAVFYKPNSQLQLVLVVFLILISFAVLGQKMMEAEVGLAPLYFLALVQLTPILICTIRYRYTYMAFILFNHFFSYSLHKYNQIVKLRHHYVIPPETLHAIQELTICTIIMLLGYHTARFVLPSKRSNEPYQLLTLKKWQLLVVSLYVIFVPFFLEYIPTWYVAIHFTIMGADMMLLLSSNSPGHEKLALILKILVFCSAILFFIYTGMLTLVGFLAAYLFIAACVRRKFILLIIPMLLTIVGSAIQTVKNDYRKGIVAAPSSSAFERMALLSGLLTENFYSGGEVLSTGEEEADPDSNEEKLLSGFQRVGDDSLERVLSWTPKRVPFWEGETYAHIPFIFIPRVLWPSKPSRHIWHKFGHIYGYLGENDNTTSVGVTYFAEAYMNFGYTGMYTVALFFGFFVWAVELLAYSIIRGNFAFTFMIFLIPLQWYAADLGTILNSVFILTVVLLLFRNQILGMARNDVYSVGEPAR